MEGAILGILALMVVVGIVGALLSTLIDWMDKIAALAPMPEDRAAMILRWEREGRLDPNCPGCREFYESPGLPSDVWAPSHKASNGCESGKRAHCTCSYCWD